MELTVMASRKGLDLSSVEGLHQYREGRTAFGAWGPPLHSTFLRESSQLPVFGAFIRSSLQSTDWLVSSCKNRNLSSLFQCSKASGIKSKLPARCPCILPPLATALHCHATTLWAAIFAHAVPSAGKAFLQLSPVSSYASFKTHLTPTSLSSSQSEKESAGPFLDPKALSFPLCVSICPVVQEFLFICWECELPEVRTISFSAPSRYRNNEGMEGIFLIWMVTSE